ncbi:patatin-like phospholipase family protein [Paeniroseomonas aquatica]|uniref:Patatin-like phospholipase family protein n=2 Tax=Paeniroseomonas aquatica TaxID=373043 RepID=A0ABT8AHN8_9PROT|nr:patatin-like phospholipase family protein [Paeniroseomonas aquatica]MDN3568966.1 patatin-like phospholipase family protein [Paeniroseomonas aquatica]
MLKLHRRLASGLRGSALILLMGLAGCASILRLEAPPTEATVDLPILGIPNARFWPDGAPEALRREAATMLQRQRARTPGALPPANFLALSGGGDNGAYGAGLLTGWTAVGSRPEFDVVTGISAGALIAPFAFLGPGYDPHLREVFTELAPRDVLLLRRIPFALLFNLALADTSPLYRLIEQQVDAAMLAAIAREYARGRLLLIGTTNLDLQRPVVWNIGAIAASGHPSALVLFRRILLASASIPGAFPPVLIDVEHASRPHQEMHVDGGAATQVFFYPPALDARSLMGAAAVPRPRTVWVVRNGRMDVEGANVDRGLVSIASRSLATLLHFSGVGDISRIFLTAQRDGMEFRLSFIGSNFRMERREPFDRPYMRALFDYGARKMTDGEAWATEPPAVATLGGTADRPAAR